MKKYIICIVILTITSFTSYSTMEPQWEQNWCWAACVQDILAQAGTRQTQSQIAARLDGWPRDRPASSAEVVALLRSYGLYASQAGRPGSPQELYGSLNSGAKLIAFVRPTSGPIGHFIVIQGYDRRDNALIVSDPIDGRCFRESPANLYNAWRWGDAVVVRTSGGDRSVVMRQPCTHPLHPNGDIHPCRHGPMHPNGDLVPCQHPIFTPNGPQPAHYNGDLIPCQHGPVHPRGDISPCEHPAHPAGH